MTAGGAGTVLGSGAPGRHLKDAEGYLESR